MYRKYNNYHKCAPYKQIHKYLYVDDVRVPVTLAYPISEALHDVEFPPIQRFLQTYLIYLTKLNYQPTGKVFLLRGYLWTIIKVTSTQSMFT